MQDLKDGESTEMQGSGVKPYTLKNSGGVYSCSCPAWRNQSLAIERRTCKHLIKLRGADVEKARTQNTTTAKADSNDADETKEAGTAEDPVVTKDNTLLITGAAGGIGTAVVKALNPQLDGFEASCFDGRYITGDVTAEDFATMQAQRKLQFDEEDNNNRSRLALQGAEQG